MSIQDSFGKIKSFLESDKGKDILVVLIVVLVGLSSFGLGRLSKSNDNAGIRIKYSDKVINQEANIISSAKYSNILQNDKISTEKKLDSVRKNFFASNRGSKYYPLGCSAGKSIKQENRIYFDTSEKAEVAGYELSQSCN